MRGALWGGATAMAVAAAAVMFVSAAAGAWAQTKESSDQKTGTADRGVGATTPKEQPPVSIRVTLSVYSGRPNPSWTVEPGPDLDRLVGLIQSLKPTDAKLFDYDEWNRLGYASFWLSARGIAGVPSEVHVWRDMAFVASKEGKGMQAIGASKLYETLVTQAEGNGQQRFFVNYRKLPPTKGGAQ
jgi:hypothetical protein